MTWDPCFVTKMLRREMKMNKEKAIILIRKELERAKEPDCSTRFATELYDKGRRPATENEESSDS